MPAQRTQLRATSLLAAFAVLSLTWGPPARAQRAEADRRHHNQWREQEFDRRDQRSEDRHDRRLGDHRDRQPEDRHDRQLEDEREQRLEDRREQRWEEQKWREHLMREQAQRAYQPPPIYYAPPQGIYIAPPNMGFNGPVTGWVR